LEVRSFIFTGDDTMIKLFTSHHHTSSFGKFYKVLNYGGMIKVNEKIGILFGKPQLGKWTREVSIVVLGNEMDENAYFGKLDTEYVKKTQPKKEKPEAEEIKTTEEVKTRSVF
jgi:hypothetical protein